MKSQICVLLWLLSLSILAQTNYYVSTTGSNANDGSLAMPWQTVQYASTQLAPGDTLNIMAGNYLGNINLTVAGTANAIITIRNHENEVVNIHGMGLPNYQQLLNIEEVNYITVSGIHFRDYQKLDAIGVRIVNSSYISILNNTFSNIDYATSAVGETPGWNKNSQPIIVFGRDPLNPITNLRIHANTIYNCEVGRSECLSVNGNVDGFELTNNHVYNNTNIGIVAIGFENECPDPEFDQARNGIIRNNLVHDNPSAYSQAAGIYIDGAKNMLVENNWSYNNDYGIEVGCEDNGGVADDPESTNIIVRNNVVYNNSYTGIAVGGYNYPSTGKVTETTISHNTFFANDTDNTYTGEITISYVENIYIENNIFYATNSEQVLLTTYHAIPSVYFDYNIFYEPTNDNYLVIEIDGNEYNDFTDYQNSTGKDANSSFVNPSFVSDNLNSLDIHLTENSPAIDAGNPAFVPDVNETDIDGDIRLHNTSTDCGADEFFTETFTLLALKAYLSGAYNETTQNMESNLVTIAPTNQPFTNMPWGYMGNESVNVFPPNFIDWVLVELRDAANPAVIVLQKAALLLADGTICDVNDASFSHLLFDNINENANYYIALKPRNHLAIMSANTINLSLNNTYDFTLATNVMGNTAQVSVMNNGSAALRAGDWNNDGIITVSDFNGYMTQTATINAYLNADFTLDGTVTVNDFNAYKPHISIIGVNYIRY